MKIMPLYILSLLLLIQAPMAMAETQLELRDGSILKGEVLEKTTDSVTFKTLFGTQKIPLDQLSAKSLSELKPPSANDPAALLERIVDLEKKIAALESENQKLRRELVSQPIKPTTNSTPSPQPSVVSQPPAASSQVKEGGYWISSTGKRHNSNCRYFKTSKGRDGTGSDGVACKICGG